MCTSWSAEDEEASAKARRQCPSQAFRSPAARSIWRVRLVIHSECTPWSVCAPEREAGRAMGLVAPGAYR